MFNKVDPKRSFSDLELDVLKYWEENSVFEKSVESRVNQEKYVFFDGPPFANGLPHYGHILANVLKDSVTRYWTMRGFYVPRTNGWDCHGLPVEYEIEKELELSGRKAIVDFGVENFNTKCRESVFRYTAQWNELLSRIARWVDFDNGYATLDNNYMESIWWVFKQIWDKDMVYSGFKSMHVCPRCETPLSNFEVSQGYKDVTDLTVIAKFKLSQEALGVLEFTDLPVFVLAWTTTPWTLPGNTALAFGKEIEYVLVEVKRPDEAVSERYILAAELILKVLKDLNYVVLQRIDQSKLVGKAYEPLFDYYKNSAQSGNAYSIQVADFVTTEDGTGIVHIAPMFGEDDYNLSEQCGLARIQHVGMDGLFKPEVVDFAGKFVKGQDGNVAKFLEEAGLLFKKENHRHSYPHCWRCDTPLLNFATKSFFVKVSEIKERLLKNNQKINWQPAHIQDGRFGKWLEGARDWAVSRNRFWGCPIPIWESESGEQICVGSIEELKKLSGGDLPLRDGQLDLHKPFIDDIVLKSPTDGSPMRRVPDVLDCWFESGAMPYAQLHYPFENRELFEKNFPANFIAEGLDQTRGWFYTLHVISTILFDEPAFKNVIVNGILLAKDGQKLSKRKKNYPDPADLFSKKGVDATRMFLLSSPAALAEAVRFSEDHVDDVLKKFLIPFWNTYSFFITYASIDNFDRNFDQLSFKSDNPLDQWMLSKLTTLVREVTESMDAYNLPRSTRALIEFVDDLSNWYVRRSRRRFWKSENDGDKNSAYRTLYIVLVEFSKLIAPFAPFVADEVYRNLTGELSVHLANWPLANHTWLNLNLNDEVATVRTVVNLGHGLRAKKSVKVRQPLSKISIALPQSISPESILAYSDVILDELNVKTLDFIPADSDMIKRKITLNSKVIGPKFGAKVQALIAAVKEGKYEILESGEVAVLDVMLKPEDFEIGFTSDEGFDTGEQNGIVVMLDLRITEELRLEGVARDLIRSVQELRKKADLVVDDRILLLVRSKNPQIVAAIDKFSDYVKTEVLAQELMLSGELTDGFDSVLDFDGEEIFISIKKTN